jgi:hypothetical protein
MAPAGESHPFLPALKFFTEPLGVAHSGFYRHKSEGGKRDQKGKRDHKGAKPSRNKVMFNRWKQEQNSGELPITEVLLMKEMEHQVSALDGPHCPLPS